MQARHVLAAFAVVAAAAALAAADDPKAPGAAPPAAKPQGPKPSAAAPKAAPGDAAKPKTGTSVASAPAQGAPRNLEDALRRLGRRRADVDFREMSLDAVVEFLSKVGGVNLMVSPALQAKSQGALPVVTLKLADVSLRQCAELVAKTTGSKLAFRDGVLQFTTPEDARGTPVLRLFSIADLTFRVRNFPGPDIQLHVGGAQYVQEEETEQESPLDDPQAVVDMIRKYTGEGTWDDEDVSISADGRKLVVRQYPEVLREISRFLAVLRATK